MRARRATGVVVGIAALVAGPTGAAANEGPLYPYGPSIWATSPQFSGTVLPGPVWQIQAPALSPAALGNHFEMNWGCPVGGSEIAAVRFGGLRTQAPSSLAVRVTGNRAVLWEEGDASMPQSPAGGRAYEVSLPPGQCNVHLALTQVEARAQHARGYFIDNPRILVRDLAPPTVALRSLPSGWLGPGATVPVEWTTADNFGADGVGAQRVVIAGVARWTGAPGTGDHGATVPLDGIGDGVHEVVVQADGDGTPGGAAGGTIRVDRTPPTATALAAGATGRPGVLSVAWTAADALSGVAGTTAELNAATDGTPGGAWVTVAPERGAGRADLLVGAPVPDGLHAWRVRTADAAGNVALTPGPGALVVDTTAPRLDLHGVPAGWVRRADLDVTATDNLEAALGPVRVEVDVNTAPDGGEAGSWQSVATADGPAGRRLIPVDLAGLASGRHAVRVVARNGSPLGATLVTERRTVLRIDTERPAIGRSTFAPGPGGMLDVAWSAEDPHSGVATAAVQWRDAGGWRTLGADQAGDGTGSMTLDVAALPPGRRSVRLLIADAAGNTAVRSGAVSLSRAAGVGGAAPAPLARLRRARLSVSVAGARVVRRAGRRVLVRRIGPDGVVRVRGRLTDRSGRGIAGKEVRARGFRGRPVGRAITRRNGSFVLLLRPLAGGRIRIGVPVGGALLPARASADVEVRVRPRVALAASATDIAAGDRVLFTGRLHPSPGALGLGARKGIVLEWRDPVRHSWRPVVNARIRRDGTFAVPWTFGLRGLTIPMRVTVPAEVGWPLLPVRSRVVRVRVG